MDSKTKAACLVVYFIMKIREHTHRGIACSRVV